MPDFPLVDEDENARQGFLTDEQYGSLRDALPDYLKPLFGWGNSWPGPGSRSIGRKAL
jgi:hypothetical protein